MLVPPDVHPPPLDESAGGNPCTMNAEKSVVQNGGVVGIEIVTEGHPAPCSLPDQTKEGFVLVWTIVIFRNSCGVIDNFSVLG